MTPEQKAEIQKMIDDAFSFKKRKLGDTPTDAQQLTPKKYVDATRTTIIVNGASVIGSVILSSGAGISIGASGSVITIGNTGQQFSSTFGTGEAISSMAAVVMGFTESSLTGIASVGVAIDRSLTQDPIPTANALWGQTYIATKSFIKQVTLPLAVGGTGSWNFTCAIETTSGNLPTDSIIGQTSSAISAGGSLNFNQDFIFANPIPWVPGNTYAIVLNADNLTNSPHWYYVNSSIVPGRQVQKAASVWSAPDSGNDDFGYWVYETATIGGSVYLAKSSANDSRANNFLGFSPGGAPAFGTAEVVYEGKVSAFGTNLSPGATYYLSDTAGAISSVAGTVSRKIGMALTSSVLLIKHDNA